jgi:hypothetical protein
VRHAAFLLVPFGVVLMTLGIWIAVRPNRNEITTLDAFVQQKHRSGYGEAYCTEPFEFINSSLKFNISHPEEVRLGDSFIIRAKVTVAQASIQRRDDACTDKRIEENLPEEQKIARAKKLLTSGELGFELHLAGADVKPDTVVTAPEGVLQWSVYPKSAGTLSGFVWPWPTIPEETLLHREIGYYVHTDDDNVFRIKVEDRFFTRDRIVSLVMGFGGTLLTLPGILSFLQERRRRKEEAKKQSLSDSRIIVP